MQRFQQHSGTIGWTAWRIRAVLLAMAAALIGVVLHAYVLSEAEAEDAASGSAEALVSTRWRLAFAALLIGTAAVAGTIAQSGSAEAQGQTAPVKVAVQILAADRLEFAIEHEGERLLPDTRFLNTERAARSRWLTSSAVEIQSQPSSSGMMSADPDGSGTEVGVWATPGFGTVSIEVRVGAWSDAEGSVWFAIAHNGEYLLPERRKIRQAALAWEDNHNRWFTSSEVEIEIEETPADILRSFSSQIVGEGQYETLVDVAQDCSLESVDRFEGDPDPDYDWDNWPNEEVAPDGYPMFLWKVDRSEWSTSSSSDAVWVHRNEQATSYWTGRPAPGYLFIVRDVRPPDGATMWAAVFRCADEGGSDGNDIDIGS